MSIFNTPFNQFKKWLSKLQYSRSDITGVGATTSRKSILLPSGEESASVIRGTSILNGASSGANSGWLPISTTPERFSYALDSGSTTTTFSVDISTDGINSIGQAFTGTWARSDLVEITPPVMFSNPQAQFFRWNVLSGGPLSVKRGI